MSALDTSVAATFDGRADPGHSYTDRWGRAQLAVHDVMIGAMVDDAEDIAAIATRVDAVQRSRAPHLSVHQASIRAGYLIAGLTPARAALVVAAAEALATRRPR